MKQKDVLLLLALLVMGRRVSSSSREKWAPMGPFKEEDTLPAQPTIPPNPLGKP